jgi:hypothetical protein
LDGGRRSAPAQLEVRQQKGTNMISDPIQLISDFITSLQQSHGLVLEPALISHQHLPAPHNPTNLINGCGAVYTFTTHVSSTCQAGPNRALKVGKVGPDSNPRFKYQHYSGSANSTLAGAIKNNCILWDLMGYSSGVENTGKWIKDNLDRDDFFIALHPRQREIIKLLEVYLKARLGPMYEGTPSKTIDRE